MASQRIKATTVIGRARTQVKGITADFLTLWPPAEVVPVGLSTTRKEARKWRSARSANSPGEHQPPRLKGNQLTQTVPLSPHQEGAKGRVNFQIPAQHKLKREERARLPGYPQCGAGGQRQPQAGVPVPEQLDSSDQLFRNRWILPRREGRAVLFRPRER